MDSEILDQLTNLGTQVRYGKGPVLKVEQIFKTL